MQRGTQGHVAEPHGPTSAIFIFIYIFYMVYSKYKRPDYRKSLTHKTVTRYLPDDSLYFSPCGTMFHSCFESHAMWLKAMRWIKSAWIIACRCSGL